MSIFNNAASKTSAFVSGVMWNFKILSCPKKYVSFCSCVGEFEHNRNIEYIYFFTVQLTAIQ